MHNNRVVIVEDDLIVARFLQAACESAGYIVAGIARDAKTACATIVAERPGSVLMDVRLIGERDGVDVALETHKTQPDLRVIYITGSNEQETMNRIMSDHPYQILIKPVSAAQISNALQ